MPAVRTLVVARVGPRAVAVPVAKPVAVAVPIGCRCTRDMTRSGGSGRSRWCPWVRTRPLGPGAVNTVWPLFIALYQHIRKGGGSSLHLGKKGRPTRMCLRLHSRQPFLLFLCARRMARVDCSTIVSSPGPELWRDGGLRVSSRRWPKTRSFRQQPWDLVFYGSVCRRDPRRKMI